MLIHKIIMNKLGNCSGDDHRDRNPLKPEQIQVKT